MPPSKKRILFMRLSSVLGFNTDNGRYALGGDHLAGVTKGQPNALGQIQQSKNLALLGNIQIKIARRIPLPQVSPWARSRFSIPSRPPRS